MQLPQNTLELLDKAIASVERRPELADRERMLHMLRIARAEAERAMRSPLRDLDPTASEAALVLSLIISAHDGVLPSPPEVIVGWLPGEDLDPGWISSLINYFRSKRVPFRTHDASASPDERGSGVVRVADDITITMVGDWGIGNASSSDIARCMRALHPNYTIHLGDVYYSGTPDEERERFTFVWPAGRDGAFALNSNHEMYAGGEGYFEVALADDKFSLQDRCSYFALENSNNIIFGLDSAYPSHAWLYEKGELDEVQLRFLRKHAKRARDAGKRITVLTHHQPINMDGTLVAPLWEQVTNAVGPGDLSWYWGHIHGAAVFKPKRLHNGVTIHGRCVGHGGIPYTPFDRVAAMEWTEPDKADDPDEGRRALNGFVSLRFAGDQLEETFYDEKGRMRHRMGALAKAA
ncbi:Hypothetical protein A7982_05384 [Minicystis rosea]|nr:Hypothetical protein A7982_05384 [Minicystis rosea]